MSYQDLTGKVIVPKDPNYDEARTIYNAMIDKKPAVIVTCKTKADVINVVNFARDNNTEVSVRSGGHNGAGLALVDGGLVVDLSEMKAIAIDPLSKTVIVQPGNTLSDVDAATHEFGLALPSGIIGTTGIGGITLGGGLGYLSRKGGLTIDHLLECEVVLSNGNLVVANKDTNPDLFWALRGGGGNFGVVVSFKFSLIDIKNVYAGPMFWPIEQAEEAMVFYDTILKTASNDLYGFFAFLIVPPAAPFPEHLWNQNVCGVVWNYTGPIEKAEEVFKPIREFGTPILDFVSEIPMPALNGMFDALYPPGLQWYWRAHYIKELTPEAIKVNVTHGSKVPTMHSTMHLYPIDGVCHDVANSETAWANREARWAQVIVGVDPNPANAETITNWCKNYFDALIPHAMGGAYVNFMMNEGQERIKASYKDNYERLVQVKTKYDPNNFFHINQNIKPQ
ncbi:oxidoreductase [Mangrovimonas yunxiaonensis]|uniref:Oxidoreductase n=1 Tax=Mangrovimonas yunxiaonensis TaxID=1197477 RepID=A0A084TMF0_9FLAO|nr:FAD-dependent oxidoreductase [Mangrovimonas yunxiaonensis]KFB01886.1 oxidoreductase [Mangrovimonas yunxiaonensis]GGH44481.1 oxidoreductase [Mangrovimonas yunxiaonensis]